MPYEIIPVPKTKTRFSVINKETGEIHAKSTTKKKADTQLHLLNSIDGEGLLDTFNPDDKKSPVELISFNDSKLIVPAYFIKRVKDTKNGKRKFKLVAPTTKTRNLSTRGHGKSINLIRANIDGLVLEPADEIIPIPNLSEFSKADRFRILDMYDEIVYNETNDVMPELPLETRKPQKPNNKPKLVRGKTTMPKDEALLRKKASKKESAKRIYQEKKKAKGEGLFQMISKAKKGFTKAVNTGEKAVMGAVRSGERFVEAVFNPDSAYPPNVKQIKDDHGDEVITRLILRRNPVSSVITGLMNAVSLGSFYKKLGRQDYDKLFHLALLVVTDKGGFLLEKIERVNVSKDMKLQKGTEELEINNIPANLTVRELIENTEKEMGSNFLPYNPMTNNCQVFIMNVLKANGLLNSTYEQWIKQDTDALFAKDPFLLSLSNKLIQVGQIGNIISQGGNLLSNDNIQMMHHRIPHSANLINLQLHGVMSQIPEALETGKSVHGEGVGRFFKGIGRTVTKGVSSGVDTVSDAVSPVTNVVQDVVKVANQVGAMPSKVSSAVGDAMSPDNLTNAGHEIANILYRRGLPMTASTLGYIAGNMVGGPVGGIALGTAASYGTSRAVNEYQPKGLGLGMGLYAGHSEGNGLYAGGAIGMMSPPPIGMKPRSTVKRIKIPMNDMDGGKLLIDRKFSVRDIAHGVNNIVDDAPKAVVKTYNELKGAGVKKTKMAKGSPEMKEHMARIRAMKKK